MSWTNKAQLWWASFLSPVLRKIFDYENGSYQTNSRRQLRYSWAVQQAPKHLSSISYRSNGCCFSSTRDLWFLPESSSFRAPQANRNTKRLHGTEEWPTDAQQELQRQIASSFDISAKVFIPPLSFISTKLSILAARIKIFTYNLSISDTNKHTYLKYC